MTPNASIMNMEWVYTRIYRMYDTCMCGGGDVALCDRQPMEKK